MIRSRVNGVRIQPAPQQRHSPALPADFTDFLVSDTDCESESDYEDAMLQACTVPGSGVPGINPNLKEFPKVLGKIGFGV